MWAVFLTTLVLAFTQSQCSSSHPGHLKPLGLQKRPDPPLDEHAAFIEPGVFQADYVRGSIPVIFRGAAVDIPAYDSWTDEFLLSAYGKVGVEVYVGKKEKRPQKNVQMPMVQFLKLYEKKQILMKTDITKAMRGHLSMPRSHQCGGFQKLLETVRVNLHSGGTKSVLHKEQPDVFRCFLDGEAEFVIFQPQRWPGPHGWHSAEGYSDVDPDAVDLDKFPQFLDLPWWQAHLHKGDCIFIPMDSYITENTSKGRTLSIDLSAFPIMWLDQSDCDQKQPLSNVQSLENYKIWMLDEDDGQEASRHSIFERVETEDPVTLDILCSHWLMEKNEAQPILDYMDTNSNGVLDWSEIYAVDMVKLHDMFPYLDVEVMYARQDEMEEKIRKEEEEKAEEEEAARAGAAGSPNPGHLEPLGNQRPPKRDVDEVEGFLHPKLFFDKYTVDSEPVIFKGAAKALPAFEKWTDEYLKAEFGKLGVSVALGQREARRDHAQKHFQMPFSQFLGLYDKKSVHLAGFMSQQMEADVPVPRSLQCGGFERLIDLSWIQMCSGKHCKTPLKITNTNENIYCMLDGQSDFYIIKRYDEQDGPGWASQDSVVDVDAVDTVAFPQFNTLPWLRARVEKGDCLYLPFGTWYYRHSHGSRNLAVDYWYVQNFWFNATRCDADTLKEVDSMENYDILDVPSKVLNESYRFDIFEKFELLWKPSMTVGDMVSTWGIAEDKVLQVVGLMDLDKNGELSWEEIYSADMVEVVKACPFVDRLQWEKPDPEDQEPDIKEEL